MIVDFALLAGMWSWKGDPVPRVGVCTIRYAQRISYFFSCFDCIPSSNVCRMMAVGLGWANAFGNVDETGEIDEDLKGWVEIENKGIVVPVWTAFELF
jgi:hypothetical protein